MTVYEKRSIIRLKVWVFAFVSILILKTVFDLHYNQNIYLIFTSHFTVVYYKCFWFKKTKQKNISTKVSLVFFSSVSTGFSRDVLSMSEASLSDGKNNCRQILFSQSVLLLQTLQEKIKVGCWTYTKNLQH